MMTGKIIDGRYEIIEEIGRGGMAIVYRAKCLVLNRYVAIKVLRPEYRDDQEFIKRFKIEAQSAGSLSHPNIVSIYDVGNEDDIEYIVMEYVEGITLKQYLSTKGTLPWKEAVDYASQICAGLEHAHKKGIVHKDVKPENVIITKEGILKITDFGIAKALNQGTITTGGLTMGSVHYFSPEQARGGFTDAKTDLYSLGILLYEMVSGKLPFEGENAVSIAMQHIEKEPIHPSVFNPSLPRSLEAVVLKAMKKEQSERYQTATQMLIDLKKVYVGSEVSYGDEPEMTKKFKPITPEDAKKKPVPPQNDTPPARKPQPGAPKKRKMTPEEIRRAKKKKKQKDALGILAGVLAGIATLSLIVAFVFVIPSCSVSEVDCPDLVGLTCSEALAKIDDIPFARLKLVDIESGQEIDEESTGIIQEQNPRTGKNIKNNTTIRVVLSEEPLPNKRVPSVVGMTESNAAKTLKAQKFQVIITRQDHETVAEGYVIGTSPSANSEAPEGSSVTIYVSTGEQPDDEYVIVPSLIGETKDDAQEILESLGLKLGETVTVNSAKTKGTVVSQSRTKNDRAKKGTVIDVQISNGKGSAPSAAPTESAPASATPTATTKPTPTATAPSGDTPTISNPGGSEATNE